MIGKLFSFLKSTLSERDGTGSNTRLCVMLIVVFALGWVTSLFSRVHGPVTVADIRELLPSMASFVGLVCGPLYAINKAADVMNNRAPDLAAQVPK